jgi:RNA polymerase sigma-70 factor (ECF subfamily)
MNPATAPLPPATPTETDCSLLRRLRNGNENAATQLYLRYSDRLLRLARTRCSSDLALCLEADDIVQSVFASFFRGVSKGYYDVPPGEELWNLLLVIALNKIRAKGNFHRAAKRDTRLTLGGDVLEESGCEQGSESGLTFLRLVIDEALEQWPPEHVQMIVLRIEGYDVREIAGRTRRSKRTVERVLQEFRVQLAGLLDREE